MNNCLYPNFKKSTAYNKGCRCKECCLEKRKYNKKYLQNNLESNNINSKKYYQNNKLKCLTKAKNYYNINKETCLKNSKKYHINIKNYINSLKLKSGCSKCGYNKHHVALEYHHIDSKNKTINIARCGSIKRANDEIKKCIILCSNCHKELHTEQKVLKDNYKNRRRKVNKKLLDNYKIENGGCIDCGCLNILVLEMDYVSRKDKKFNIGREIYRNWKTVLEECRKCEIRCRNCHQIKTYKENRLR